MKITKAQLTRLEQITRLSGIYCAMPGKFRRIDRTLLRRGFIRYTIQTHYGVLGGFIGRWRVLRLTAKGKRIAIPHGISLWQVLMRHAHEPQNQALAAPDVKNLSRTTRPKRRDTSGRGAA